MEKALKKIAQQVAILNDRAYAAYTPEVENIIFSECTDEEKIQHLLDGLLDFCGSDKILILYKKLCRCYWKINPQATADYVNIYREMWNNKEE